MSGILKGLKILVLEDELLIAMDVEQLCRDHGADDVVVGHELAQIDAGAAFDAAILDIMLRGESTLDFATHLQEQGTPFVFATGNADDREVARRFPGAAVVAKPFAGRDLVAAVALASGRSQTSRGV